MHKLNVLIIYLLSLLSSEAQSLRIEYKTTITANEKIVDSITNQKEFQNFNQLSEYNDSIIRRLHLTGYINLLAKPLRKENEKTYIQVLKLNKKVRYAKIEASSENKELKELIETSLSRKRNNNIIEIKDINEKTEEIYQFISDEGYPFTQITTQPLYNNKKADTLTLRLDISIRDKRKIDNIVVKGYNKFPKKYLDRIINQHLTLNQNNINTITTLLKDIPFIQIEKEPEIQFKKDSTIIYTYLSKRNSNSADGLIGFNNTESGRIELNGYIDLTLLNNLNRGEKLNIVYRGENEDQTKLDINLEIPYILNSNLGITSGLNLLRRDSTYQNTSINAGLFYSITPKSSLGLSYNNKQSTTNQSTTNQSDDSINDYESNNAIFNFKHLTPSIEEIYIIDFLTDLQIGIGNRTTTTESNNQILIEATILKNLYIDNKQSIHLENRNKYLGSKNILFNELYQIGGINSIRGFNQNSIDTSLFSTINTEYRYLLNKQIYLHSILDYAIFEDYTTKKVRNIYAIGFGAAILTQSGILRLSVANGSFSGANIDFSSTVAHINLLINF